MVLTVDGSMVMYPPYAVITWHPYPQEKPNEDRLYLVTVKTAYVDAIQWLEGRWYGYSDRDVIAWAEMPKPYEVEG